VSKQFAVIFFKTTGCEKEQLESVKKCDFGDSKNKQVSEKRNNQFQSSTGHYSPIVFTKLSIIPPFSLSCQALTFLGEADYELH